MVMLRFKSAIQIMEQNRVALLRVRFPRHLLTLGIFMKKLFSVTIHDCDVQTFRSGGPGGQNQNKRETGVRVIHRPSGAVGECREERSQLQNKQRAFRRMAESAAFKLWVHKQTHKETQVEDLVARDMMPKNLKVEIREENTWKEIQ